MRQPRCRRRCFDKLNTVLAEPVPNLHEEERDKHHHEARVELLPEYSHCQACLHERIFAFLKDALHLGLAQRAQK